MAGCAEGGVPALWRTISERSASGDENWILEAACGALTALARHEECRSRVGSPEG